MFSDQVSTCAAPKTRRTKLLATAAILPILGGSAVALGGAAQGATGSASGTVSSSARTDAKPSARSLAKKERALKVKRSKVFVVGDSLTVGSKRSIQSNLKRQTSSVQVNAQVGRFTHAGIPILRSSQAKRANVWVVALGTNDGPNAGTAKRNVRKVMKLAGKRQVVWLTLVRPGKYERVNAALKQLDSRYQNLTVADWANVVKQNKRLLAGDRVHLTAHGYKIRGQYVASSVVQTAGK